MQENVTSRKIDASMGLLENIIKENPKIKPKVLDLLIFLGYIGEIGWSFGLRGLKFYI